MYLQLKNRLVIVTLSILSSLSVWSQIEYNPKANPRAVIQLGNARFTVLTPEMIRIQYSSKGLFEDRATFAVVNRNLPVPKFTHKVIDGKLIIRTSALELTYKVGAPIDPNARNSETLGIRFLLNNRTILWYPGKDDALNLMGTTRTLDGQIGDNKRAELEKGILSRSGWSLIDESPRTLRGDGSTTFAFDHKVDGIDWLSEPVDKDAIDWYFMCYGHDYKRALGDFVRIAGRIPMPPKYIFGYWYSKYQRYTANDFKNIATEIRDNQIPLDVMIFDMDWHTKGWTGWTWDKTIIPEPEKLIDFMHQRNLKVALNLHPADGVDDDEEYFYDMVRDMHAKADTKVIPWQLEDSIFYKSLFRNILRKREAQGVDFWWLDWQQNLTSKYIPGLSETFWCNHVFFNDMRLHRPDRRPVIFHRWGGLGSHRYPIGFSGDSFSTFGTLAFQPYFTSTASNVCFGYWGHDLGGHQQFDGNDPELYLRWMQFGVFTPIFRTHATNWPGIERRIWKYPNFHSLRSTVNLRYSLIPYIYNAARQAYDTGVSICRPLYYDYPEENEAYRREDQYMFGDNILVAPVLSRSDSTTHLASREIWLPEGMWYDVTNNCMIEGGRTFTKNYGLEEIPYFFKKGAIIPRYPHITNLQQPIDTLVLQLVPGEKGILNYYEDAGDDQGYQKGQFSVTPISKITKGGTTTLTIKARKGSFKNMATNRTYKVVILMSKRPKWIKLNGHELAGEHWCYDETKRRLSVIMSSLPLNKSHVLKIEDI
jgi:alpha-glucosidase (family GH31 glycosyl hydrolase)